MKQSLKNATPYRLMGETAKLSVEDWQKALEQRPHRLPTSQELCCSGFVAPFGEDLVEQPTAGMIVIAMKESYRDLPSSVVNEEVQKKVDDINQNEGRPVGRKERQTLKDEVIFTLLPQCFIKHRTTYALIFNDLIVVDSSSAKRAEDLLSLIRQQLGKLHAVPVDVALPLTQMMTHWVREGLEGDFALGEVCQMASSRTTAKVNVKSLDLQSEEVSAHLDGGLFVQKLALEFNGEVEFELDDGLQIRKIRFGDVIDDRIDEHAGEAESAREYCIASMVVTGNSIALLIRELIKALGGEKEFELEQEAA